LKEKKLAYAKREDANSFQNDNILLSLPRLLML